MHFFCQQEILAHALQIVSRAIPVRSTLPILSGIYMEYKNNTVILRTTDLEIGMELILHDIEGEKEGSVVFSGKRFTDIVKYLPSEKISLSFLEEANLVSIETRHASFQLPVLPVQEFPALPEVKSENAIHLSFGELKEGIKKTSYATLPEDIRPFLTAVLFETAPGELKMVATDINRLAVKTQPLPAMEKGAKILIPARTLQEISKLPLSDEEEIKIELASRQFMFKGKNITLYSRLVEAQFPDYEKVIPKKFTTSLVVKKVALLQALERVSLMVPSVRIGIEDDKIVISANEPEIGRGSEEIFMEKKEGENIVIGFNARFLTDFLNVVDTEEIKFSFSGEEKPAVLEGKGEEKYFYVVMPMKLN